MPWKYLRMTRRCTCVTPDLEEKEINDMLQRFSFRTAAFLCENPAADEAAGFLIPDSVFWDCRPNTQTDN